MNTTALIEKLHKQGFPHYENSKEYRQKYLKNFFDYDFWKEAKFLGVYPNKSYGFGVLQSGIKYLWSYFSEERATVRCGNLKTPMDLFNDKDKLAKLLEYNIEKNKGVLTQNSLRDWLLKNPEVQCISNFRPTAASAIYDLLLPFDESVVWDPCMGYGGRLLGALKSDKVKVYIGDEPNTVTFKKLNLIKDEVFKVCKPFNKECVLNNSIMESEDNIPENSIDMVFTSPPYFDTEKYSNEDTQSYIKYSIYAEWKEKFLKVLIDKAYNFLRPSTGILALNVKNCKNCNDLEMATVNYALERGFILKRVHKYLMSSYSNTRNNFEPIFEFLKS